MPTINLTIDGNPVSCEKDTMLLEVALANGYDIPHLCYHHAEAPYGACRLCLVEITQGRWNWVEASCTYPVRDEGIEVKTNSEKVRRYRRLNAELLLARCPASEVVRELARSLGVEEGRLPPDGKDKCILCGLCVGVCNELVGVGAISFVGRGPARRVAVPFDEPSEVCIGCGACAEVCPTGHIVAREAEGQREIVPFRTMHRLVPCPECGRGYVTEKQLEFLKARLGPKSDVLTGCALCKGRTRAAELKRVYESLTPEEEVMDVS